MIQLNAENIKTHLKNGDQVLINGDGPYVIRDFTPNTKFDDLGFQINDGICDPHYGVITDGSVRWNRFRIINLGESTL